ncbi:MAG TPA: hypothetical protein VK892_17735, partial [Pyrinomonadaceae bacterium]|nr:hypothetical protein [Pyrinomonadaceae bacterium]
SLQNTNEEPKPHSSLSIAKQEKSKQGRIRLRETIQFVQPDVKLMDSISNLEKIFQETKWLAIIHADGNGLGEIFSKFDQYSKSSGRDYINNYRKFSIALDICTINSTGFALENFQRSYREDYRKRTGNDTIELPFVPLILGGDDLTVICDGEYAIKFTKDFLERFEQETQELNKGGKFAKISEKLKVGIEGKQEDIIPFVAKNALGANRLGICAGIAIIKPHYPFHQAYELAEQLLKSAKQVKTKVLQANGKQLPASAMDFHVLYDSSGVELNQIREKLLADEHKTYLFAKPYIITDSDKLGGTNEKNWHTPRLWEELEIRVWAMKATEKEEVGKRKLPNSQMHHIRENLFRGKAVTDSEVNLFSHRYKKKGFHHLLWKKDDPKSLFLDEEHRKDGQKVKGHTTHFLDALDTVEFWKGFSEERCKEILEENSEKTEVENEQ